MEKRGVVQPGRTPDTEDREKQASKQDEKSRTEQLDDDFTKRAADKAADSLENGK